ncbi:MAG: AI-2E family transporter, partial [Nitrosomonadales bacterium]|nr:AI-2E family transporter [Nitrosomonadales bacterium]
IGENLSKWLVGKAISMIIVGTVTTIGLMALGMPLALMLGIIAGLLDFIPYLGPLIAAVPAIMIALVEDPALALYVALLFTGIQLLQSYLLEPFIVRKSVTLPPALTIFMQVLLGSLFGLIGVALAIPFTVVLKVLIEMLYLKESFSEATADQA